jgi:hypothetical protein
LLTFLNSASQLKYHQQQQQQQRSTGRLTVGMEMSAMTMLALSAVRPSGNVPVANVTVMFVGLP